MADRGTLYVIWDGVMRPDSVVMFISGEMRSFWTNDGDIPLLDFVDTLAREIVIRQPVTVYMSTLGPDRVIFDAVSELVTLRYGWPEIRIKAFVNEHPRMPGQRMLRPRPVG